MEARYPIRAVAKMTGLTLDTLRAWERRYQAVIPDRSERGRQYGPAQIERLQLLKRLVNNGHTISQIAALPVLELENLLARPEEPRSEPPAPDLLGPLLAAVERFDALGASDELSRLAAVLAPRELVYQVALPLMRETGLRWHRGIFAVAQEHLVSQILRNLLGSMLRLFRDSGATIQVILAAPGGETHEFGILAAALLAAISGLEPIYLGPNLPALEIARAAALTSARIVAIGLVTPQSNTSAEIRSLAEALSPATELWLGGSGAASLASLDPRIILMNDLTAFERRCIHKRKEAQ